MALAQNEHCLRLSLNQLLPLEISAFNNPDFHRFLSMLTDTDALVRKVSLTDLGVR